MADLIIKSSTGSGNNLLIQGADASPAITIAETGTTTFAENATLSGTANNLGTVTAGNIDAISDVKLLATTNFTSSTAIVSFDGFFSSTYHNYQIHASNITLIAGSGTPSIMARYRRSNADITTSNYVAVGVRFYAVDAAITKVGLSGQSDMLISNENTRSTSGQNLSFLLTLYDPLATNNFKNCTFHTLSFDNGADNRHHMEIQSGTLTDSTSALSGISFYATGTNMLRGNFKLYGFK